jgi:hypothetical protein
MAERDALQDRPATAERPEARSEVRRLREQAAMLRELAGSAAAPSIASQLLTVADELEKQAARLEK